MLVREQKQTKKSAGLFVSLTIHAVLIALLFLALTEKRLAQDFFAHQRQEQSSIAKVSDSTKTSIDTTEKKKDFKDKQAEQKKQPTLNQPFVVPAPVVFYGNQAMMNKPVPISGSSEGKSAFEHSPSSLPTPPAAAIAPERTPSISAPQSLIDKAMKGQQEQNLALPLADVDSPAFDTKDTIKNTENSLNDQSPKPLEDVSPPALFEKTIENVHQGEGIFLATKKESIINPTSKINTDNIMLEKQHRENKSQEISQQSRQKKLTLIDLFKDATTTIASFAQDGLPSARKAGTEGGDDQGSGHQITIKEGDMKYYTLWANFLNHLNQAARFNRRGKETMIHAWINNREIQYILQCGITIDTQGKILDIDIMISSGCPGFDKLCISDIRSAVPYPPLPEHLGKKTARFEVNVYP